jgi:hypothetical protein
MRSSTLAGLAALALAAGLAGGAAADPAAPAAAATKPLADYSGKGAIQVTIPEANVIIGFEQAYVAPDAQLFSFDMDLLKQWSLVVGDRERTYNAGATFAVEHRYRNLQKLPVHPSVAGQLSMAQFGRVIREIKMVQALGNETLLGQECQIVRFSNKELSDNLLAKGLIGELAPQFLDKGMTKAWVTRDHGLPLRVEIYSNEGKPAVVYSFSEIKINSGLKATDLRIPAPRNVVWLNVTADVSVPGWEEIEDKEVQKQLHLAQKAQARRTQ